MLTRLPRLFEVSPPFSTLFPLSRSIIYPFARIDRRLCKVARKTKNTRSNDQSIRKSVSREWNRENGEPW